MIGRMERDNSCGSAIDVLASPHHKGSNMEEQVFIKSVVTIYTKMYEPVA